MKIAIVGAGFVGKATGLGLSKHQHKVVYVETDKDKVAKMNGQDLDAYLPKDYPKITTDVTMFCVPTPTKGDSIQLDYLTQAVEDFAKRLKNHKEYHVAIIRSTVPPKTTRELVLPLIENISGKKAGKDFGLTMQPEYLREATAVEDFERPWFILIGQLDKRSGDVVDKLYRPFDAPIERTGLEEAEFQKYVHNIYNAVKITFFNEMRIVANKENWDANTIFRAVSESCEGMWNTLYGIKDYGPFDGSCLPKDTRALIEWADKHGHNLETIKTAFAENIKHEQIIGKNRKVKVNHLAHVIL